MNNIEKIDELRRIGLSWFVMYKYYESIDDSYIKWQGCGSIGLRTSKYENNREYHFVWLEHILFDVSEKMLEKNEFGVTGIEIKNLAFQLFNLMRNKMPIIKKEVKEIPEIRVSTKIWD